ncbi:hypothetical protein VTH06DRAFT_951 [Thermothelomyces fergusii]
MLFNAKHLISFYFYIAEFTNSLVKIAYSQRTVDLERCADLRALGQPLALPWAWLFEFHGWWHVLTAVGASQAIQVAREVREELERERRSPNESD